MSEVTFYAAWEVYTQGIRSLLKGHSPNDTVWTSPDGGYAVGDILEMPDFEVSGDLYIEAGIVADYRHDEE